MPSYLRYWAKSRRTSEGGLLVHLLAHHLLDVAACAQALLRARPSWLTALRRSLGPGADEEGSLRLAVILAAVHDIGKVSAFQGLSPDACATLGMPVPDEVRAGGDWRHDNVGLSMLRGDPSSFPEVPCLLDEALGVAVRGAASRSLLATASACHHGRPTEGIEGVGLSVRPHDVEAARTLIARLRTILPGVPALPLRERDARRASLVLAALVNVADWLGSDESFFPLSHARRHRDLGTDDLEEYWRTAQTRARDAVRGAGLCERTVRPDACFSRIYPAISTPTPVQTFCDTVELEGGPTLVVVEETVGGGKTQAAITLAARMMARGMGAGVLLCLPTVATADQQASRQAEVVDLLFGEGQAASMTVAHSGRASGPRSVGDRGTAGSWLADDRRKRLLADVCVGTVDQALLAALPAKWAALRIAGLLGKVLVVDEAHAYDAYTRHLLAALLRLHASLGGSAILLSATLPMAMKRELCAAFADGAGVDQPREEVLLHPGYPLTTVLSPRGSWACPMEPAISAPPDKRVHFIHSVGTMRDYVLRAARSGRCALWVRNTVEDAVAEARELRTVHGDVQILHARFPEVDRTRIASEILSRFGPASRGAERRGGIVVATSVIEQSLDLDFDEGALDLKPIESLIQGSGRLRRHRRDVGGDPIASGTDGRGQARLALLSPDPAGPMDPDWYRDLLGSAAFVHPDHGLLWRTATQLSRMRGIRYAEMREIVALVHEGQECPRALRRWTEEAARAAAEQVSAGMSLTRAWGTHVGYRRIGQSWDDGAAPTRLGDSVEVVLVRQREQGSFLPYQGQDWLSGLLRLCPRQTAMLAPLEEGALPPPAAELLRHKMVVSLAPDGDRLVGQGCEMDPFLGFLLLSP